MIKRIKNLWKLGEYKVDEEDVLTRDVPIGDGKAEYLGEGSQQEFIDSEKEKKGLKNIFGIGL